MKDRVIESAEQLAQPVVALSASQRSLWFQYLRHPQLQGFFNVSFVARIEPALDPQRLRGVLDELARRHATFRELRTHARRGFDLCDAGVQVRDREHQVIDALHEAIGLEGCCSSRHRR